MAIFFDAIVGSASANSYATVVEYNQYRENLGLSILDDSSAQVALIRGTSFIDNQYRALWNTKNKADDSQSLHWPQDGAVDSNGKSIANDIIPNQVKESLYQYCIKSGTSTSLDPIQKTNLKMQKLDGVGEQEFFGKNADGSLPDNFKFLDTILYGLISSRSGGMRVLDLGRY